MLRDRQTECGALDRLLLNVRAGQSQVLVVRGEAGVGKSALLDYLTQSASGCRVVRASGIEYEMELPYAGLHQLCAPILGQRDRLPDLQRDALETAFGLSAGPPPDRFLIGLAVLGLLSEAADRQPLICVIDDVQWLDKTSVQALAFVGRRLLAESVGLVFALRDPNDVPELAGLRELVVGGIREHAARGLLDAALPGRMDARVRDRIVAEARGNPLALIELARGLSLADLGGGFGPPDVMPMAGRIEQSFAQRLDSMPAETRRLLLTAAAEPIGDVSLLWRAAERLGIGLDAAGPAEAAGLVEIGARVRFSHPLVRSAAYRAAEVPERREVHRALAAATDAQYDPDRRAWHRAYSTEGPDETVADELEHCAGRALARGGLAAAAAFLERATALTADRVRRGNRALAGAEAMLRAGAFDRALDLLGIAEEAQLDALPHARTHLLRAQIAFASSHGREALSLLLVAARQLEPLDGALARATYLEALSTAVLTDRASGPQVARAARRLPPSPRASRVDLLLDALTALFTDGYAVAAPIRRRAVHAFGSEDVPEEEGLRWLWAVSIEAAELWDDQGWWSLTARHVDMARNAGALGVFPLTLGSLAVAHLFAGELDAASSLVAELEAVCEATGTTLAPYPALAFAAWRGREQEFVALLEARLGEVVARGEESGVEVAQWARAVLMNGLARYDEATIAAQEATEHSHDPAPANWGLSELVEAATRSGQPEVAADAFARLAPITRAGGTDWALGIRARAHALLSEGDVAESLYREAIERLGRTRLRGELARAHLLYGEWLRRMGRRADARAELRSAHDTFSSSGAEAFAERARRELMAAGESIAKRTDVRIVLTPQEAQIARLARDGLSNPEIGAQLFISHRTVQYHLRKVFQKLDITSRNQLSRLPAAQLSSV